MNLVETFNFLPVTIYYAKFNSLITILSVFKTFNIGILLAFLIIIILLFCSAMISGAEIAFFSLKTNDFQVKMNNVSEQKKNLIHALINSPKHLLASILIANNFINIGIVVISSYIISNIFDFSGYLLLGFIIQVIVVTYLILQLGEILPKVYAAQYPVKFALLMSKPMYYINKMCYPISSLLVNTTNFIDKHYSKKNYAISMSELSHALDITSTDQTHEEERKILKRIVKFGNIDVKEIMKSRIDVSAADIDLSFAELMKFVVDAGYSRIPIYKDNFDNVVGILYIKDLLPYIEEKSDFKWQNLIRSPFFVPESKKINDLLEEFQEKKIHMAIIVDEYGGTSGIVTLEDIIEEIVGEINDEFDNEEITYSKINDNTYIFEAKTSLVDFCKIFGLETSIFNEIKGESETLAGLMLEAAGKIPEKNEKINVQKFIFQVESADKRRIKRIRVQWLGDSDKIS